MATGSPRVRCRSPPPKGLPEIPQGSADYYYLKAMEYLGVNGKPEEEEEGGEEEEEAGDCNGGLRCRQKEEDDQFRFRPGLAVDEDGSPDRSGNHNSNSSSSSSPSGTEPATVGRRRAVSLGGPWESASASAAGNAAASTRQRKLSIGSLAYGKLGVGDPGSTSKVKRKLSDGHVHWADEFQKDLTRTHPRKTYSRHPSHSTASVKPILKAQQEHGGADDCLDEEEGDCEES